MSSYEQNFTSWTDDIPPCRDSGVGSCCNEVYRQDGRRVPMHPYEDRTFRFRKEEYSLSLYGVFHGFNGGQTADFVMKRLPAELLLGQLGPGNPPDLVKDIIKQAFVSVDREYFSSIGETLAARMVLRSDEIKPETNARLVELEEVVSSGCAATVALILNNNLFLSNVGDCQAFLCHRGRECLAVTPLSIDHTLDNEDERLRLQHIGFRSPKDAAGSVSLQPLGPSNYTRCLGNYLVKGGYKEVPGLEGCKDEPVIAEPEIQGPIPLHGEELELLVIATRSVLDAVRQVTDNSQEPQKELASLLSVHLKEQPNSSLSSVAQSTLDQLVRRLAEHSPDSAIGCREDLTLLIRAFGRQQQAGQEGWGTTGQSGAGVKPVDKTLTTRSSSARPRQATRSSTTTESSGIYLAHGQELPVDEDGRIEPYVDFGPFYKL